MCIDPQYGTLKDRINDVSDKRYWIYPILRLLYLIKKITSPAWNLEHMEEK